MTAGCECGHERDWHGDCTGPCRRNDCNCRSYHEPVESVSSERGRSSSGDPNKGAATGTVGHAPSAAADMASHADVIRRSLDYRWKQDRALAALDALLADNARLREEIRLRDESQIPVIPHGAAKQLERLQVENKRLQTGLERIRNGSLGNYAAAELAKEALHAETGS